MAVSLFFPTETRETGFEEKEKSAAATMPESREASNYDEVSIEQSMLFSDGLKVYILYLSSSLSLHEYICFCNILSIRETKMV